MNYDICNIFHRVFRKWWYFCFIFHRIDIYRSRSNAYFVTVCVAFRRAIFITLSLIEIISWKTLRAYIFIIWTFIAHILRTILALNNKFSVFFNTQLAQVQFNNREIALIALFRTNLIIIKKSIIRTLQALFYINFTHCAFLLSASLATLIQSFITRFTWLAYFIILIC